MQIADALQKLKHPLSGFLPDVVLYSPVFQTGDTKVVGEVSTVKVSLLFPCILCSLGAVCTKCRHRLPTFVRTLGNSKLG
jgi:hypothetical protein